MISLDTTAGQSAGRTPAPGGAAAPDDAAEAVALTGAPYPTPPPTSFAYLAHRLRSAADLAPRARSHRTTLSAWLRGCRLTAWFVLIPLALASLLAGLAQSLGTAWGLVPARSALHLDPPHTFRSAVAP